MNSCRRIHEILIKKEFGEMSHLACQDISRCVSLEFNQHVDSFRHMSHCYFSHATVIKSLSDHCALHSSGWLKLWLPNKAAVTPDPPPPFPCGDPSTPGPPTVTCSPHLPLPPGRTSGWSSAAIKRAQLFKQLGWRGGSSAGGGRISIFT